MRAARVSCTQAASMQEAVEKAYACAAAGDAVLLSPACSSFDMFENYHHRGEVFAASVRDLKQRLETGTGENADGNHAL